MDFLFATTNDHCHHQADEPEPLAFGLARALVANGHAVTLLVPAPDRSPKEPATAAESGVTVIRHGTRSSLPTLVDRYWKNFYDHSMVVEFVSDDQPSLTSDIPATQRVVVLTGRIDHWQKDSSHYRQARVVTTLPSTAAWLRDLGLTDVQVIPPGTTPPELSLPRSIRPLWLWHGRLEENSRAEDLIQALVVSQTTLPGATAWFTTNGDPAYSQRLRQLADKLNVAERVRWLTPQPADRSAERYGHAWALVMTDVPSWGPAAAIEAYHHATPAVVYQLPGLHDVVEPDKTGLVVRPHALALARSLERLARLRHVRARLGLHAQHYARHFTWPSMAERFVDALRQRQ